MRGLYAPPRPSPSPGGPVRSCSPAATSRLAAIRRYAMTSRSATTLRLAAMSRSVVTPRPAAP
ncbi:hypothetical protein [Actinoplanes teichomyceticus]|uniref:hypothetical protein n=1 Tax=Actinoplanes teichomyceticus TaxID=1867 RepID=UPI0011AA1EE1|nr:hypothetical protein [Actinoplanes teichomyceticus]